jgi:hypothetical protein
MGGSFQLRVRRDRFRRHPFAVRAGDQLVAAIIEVPGSDVADPRAVFVGETT